MRPTALGIYIGLVAAPDGHQWMCVLFNKHGNWESYGLFENREKAQAHRKLLRKWHKTLAQNRHNRRA